MIKETVVTIIAPDDKCNFNLTWATKSTAVADIADEEYLDVIHKEL
jgi:hypothetical protein